MLVAKLSALKPFFSATASIGAAVASVACFKFQLLSSHLLTAEPFVLTRFPPLVASNKVSPSAASSHKSNPAILLGLNNLRLSIFTGKGLVGEYRGIAYS